MALEKATAFLRRIIRECDGSTETVHNLSVMLEDIDSAASMEAVDLAVANRLASLNKTIDALRYERTILRVVQVDLADPEPDATTD
jgi:hypothetical protein